VTLEELNALPRPEAYAALKACCGSSRWVEGMLERRPYTSTADVMEAAMSVWNAVGAPDWLEAFSHHPRIGERQPARGQNALSAEWSGREQRAVTGAPDTVKEELARVNREYEKRFARIYIVCASGKPAEELLAIAKDRLKNDPDTELRVAAREQGKITQLRLRKLLEVN
jgi:2-oxo-4-hydroxy-4-carboxy-5-ureidoimidazoline decarboxylase